MLVVVAVGLLACHIHIVHGGVGIGGNDDIEVMLKAAFHRGVDAVVGLQPRHDQSVLMLFFEILKQSRIPEWAVDPFVEDPLAVAKPCHTS